MNKSVKCLYFKSEKNFGDILNVNLLNFFDVCLSPAKRKNADMVAIGSLLQTLFKNKLSIVNKLGLALFHPIIVYGSGFIDNIPETFNTIRRLDVRAVRGYYSLEQLKRHRNVTISDNVAIGDPGLLCRYLFDTSHVEKKYDLGIIPHYVDKSNPLLKNIKVKNSIIIDIQQDPKTFIFQIAQCKNVISSAMHGLIAADSLGIPNVRMILSDKIIGGDYKYDDYYSAFGLENHTKIDLRKGGFFEDDVLNIAKNYKIKSSCVEKICNDLIKSFPYDVCK